MEDSGQYESNNNLPEPLQDRHQYQMLVAKLRQKQDRESQQHHQRLDSLKDSRLSQATSKTTANQEGVGDTAQPQQLIESTGGYVSPAKVEAQKALVKQQRSKRKEKETCPHTAYIGDKCVTSCRLCGIFLPKVSEFSCAVIDLGCVSFV